MKIFRIVLLNGSKHDIKAEKLEVVNHKILGQSIRKKIDQDDNLFIPVRNIAEMVEDEIGIKAEKEEKRQTEIENKKKEDEN